MVLALKFITSFCCQLSMGYLEKTPMHFVCYDLSRSLKGSLPFMVDQTDAVI